MTIKKNYFSQSEFSMQGTVTEPVTKTCDEKLNATASASQPHRTKLEDTGLSIEFFYWDSILYKLLSEINFRWQYENWLDLALLHI